MKNKKDPRRRLDLAQSRTNANDASSRRVGLREDLRVHYGEENDPKDG